ncbi:MAG: sphingomyelin phosphodiesterase [Flavobacteriales bacterium]
MDGAAAAVELDGDSTQDMRNGLRIAGLLIIFGMVTITGPSAQAQECGEQQSLDVLSWNIYMRPAALFWNGQLERARHIGEILKDSEHDVLFFQEAFGRKSRKILHKALDGAYPYQVRPVGAGRLFNSGLWVLSRIPIDTVATTTFTARMGVDRGAAKGAVLVQLTQGERTVHLVNTHLQATKGVRQQAVREQQYQQIVDLLEAHARPGVCQVVAGDLNTDQQDIEAYEAMLGTLKARNGELRRSERAARAEMPVSTWGGPFNTLVRKRSRGVIKLLDHALVREPGRREHPLNFTVERMLHLITAPWSRKHEHLSDHHPISIRLVEDGDGF